MNQKEVTTNEFGVMTLNVATNAYEASVDAPYLKTDTVSIAADGFMEGVRRMHDFLE